MENECYALITNVGILYSTELFDTWTEAKQAKDIALEKSDRYSEGNIDIAIVKVSLAMPPA